MIGCEILPFQGMYRSRGEILTPPQSSPESHSVNNNTINNSQLGMQALEHPNADVGLPSNIPDILYCKFLNFRTNQVLVRILVFSTLYSWFVNPLVFLRIESKFSKW